ncbi:hypothetical protein [Haloechinothrix salitolerans]|uniref:Uncharacterized protein n=1 Tax=Haloechinothrix salitolerans TaxID=926830 RepID=A0ABW2BU85_9PSEU
MVINEDLTAINKNANNADGYCAVGIQFAHSGTSDVLHRAPRCGVGEHPVRYPAPTS